MQSMYKEQMPYKLCKATKAKTGTATITKNEQGTDFLQMVTVEISPPSVTS